MSTTFTEEKALWLYRHYRWLEQHLPKRESLGRRSLIMPTPEFFPGRYEKDHASAEALFTRVRAHMGMSDWPCQFVQDRAMDQERQSAMLRGGVLGSTRTNDPGGTFSVRDGNEVVITYSVSSLEDPVGLVATLAHELCHYLLATVTVEPPATWSELEPLTDLSAVLEGFGVFQCNSAFQFRQWTSNSQQGWSARRKGYLTEAELGFSLAVYCVRNDIDPNIPARVLKPNPREVFCDALDYVDDLEQSA